MIGWGVEWYEESRRTLLPFCATCVSYELCRGNKAAVPATAKRGEGRSRFSIYYL